MPFIISWRKLIMGLSHGQICMGVTLTVLGPFMTTNLWSANAAEPAAVVENEKIDAAIKPYAKVSGVSGTINSIGSDTLNNLITLWAEGFRKQYPNVKIQVEGRSEEHTSELQSPKDLVCRLLLE